MKYFTSAVLIFVTLVALSSVFAGCGDPPCEEKNKNNLFGNYSNCADLDLYLKYEAKYSKSKHPKVDSENK